MTNIGLFQSKEPIAWHDNILLVLGEFSEEKPVVRIDLDSGAVEEIGMLDVFSFRSTTPQYFATPSARYLYRVQSGTMYCYDMRSGERSELSVMYEYQTAAGDSIQLLPSNNPQGTFYEDFVSGSNAWIGDGSFVFTSSSPAITGRVNLNENTIEVLYEDDEGRRSSIADVLPGKQYVEILSGALGAGDNPAQRYLVGLAEGNRVDLPLAEEDKGTWLDDATYFYGRETGGLSEVGSWLYNWKTEESVRVCQQPLLNEENLVYFPELQVIYFYATGQGINIYRANLEDNTCTVVPTDAPVQGADLNEIITVPIDLGFGGDPVSVERDGDTVPEAMALEQNYPNPFNPSTTIRYSISAPTHVDLAVYDLLGRKVNSLVSERQQPGTYRVEWEPHGIASGLYFYRLTDGRSSLRRKLTYFK